MVAIDSHVQRHLIGKQSALQHPGGTIGGTIDPIVCRISGVPFDSHCTDLAPL